MKDKKGEEQFPEGIDAESPIYDSKSKLNFVKLINVRKVENYDFYIRVVL